MKTNMDIRALALIGAKVRRDELRNELADVEATIKALQHPTAKASPLRKAKDKPKKRRKYSTKLKAAVIATVKAGATTADAAKKHGVSYNTVFNWTRG